MFEHLVIGWVLEGVQKLTLYTLGFWDFDFKNLKTEFRVKAVNNLIFDQEIQVQS